MGVKFKHGIGIKSKFILIYSVLIAITITSLILLNECRVDVYISLYILEYYILRALMSPASPELKATYLKILDIILMVIFMVIVSFRVIQILYPEYIWW